MQRHVLALCACTFLLCLVHHVQGQMTADPPAPGCQQGVNATFYDLTQSQGKYLSTQFPFLHGPGELLDTLRPADSKTIPEINFAPDSAKDLDGFKNVPQGWPHAPPSSSFGSVAMFSTKLMVKLDASWTFFVVSNSPMQFILSQNGTVMGTLATGSEPEANATTTLGFEEFITFNLTKGLYDLSIEWHGGLPGMPVSDPMLMLEYSYVADKDKTPSPSVPGSPRMVVPGSMLYTSCSDPEPVPTPTLSAAPAAAPVDPPQPVAEPPLPETPAVPPPAVVVPPPSNNSLGCSATYSITGPWFDNQGKTYSAVVNFNLQSTTPVPVPYSVVIGGAFYDTVSSPYNMEMTTGPATSGVFSGQVVEPWEALSSTTVVGIGATFASDGENFTPTILLINGDKCTLQGAK